MVALLSRVFCVLVYILEILSFQKVALIIVLYHPLFYTAFTYAQGQKYIYQQMLKVDISYFTPLT